MGDQNTILGQGSGSQGAEINLNVLIGVNAGYYSNSVHFNKNVAVGNRSLYNVVDKTGH